MNTQKSKVVSFLEQKHFKFLGFALGKNVSGVYIRAHGQSPAKAKKKLKELTTRSQGRSVRQVMEKVKVYIRGWLGYYYVADMKRVQQSWNEWLRSKVVNRNENLVELNKKIIDEVGEIFYKGFSEDEIALYQSFLIRTLDNLIECENEKK